MGDNIGRLMINYGRGFVCSELSVDLAPAPTRSHPRLATWGEKKLCRPLDHPQNPLGKELESAKEEPPHRRRRRPQVHRRMMNSKQNPTRHLPMSQSQSLWRPTM